MNDEYAVRIYFCTSDFSRGLLETALYAINSDFSMEIGNWQPRHHHYHFMVLNTRKETFLFVLVYLFIV